VLGFGAGKIKMMKYIIAARAAWKVYRELCKAQKKAKAEKRAWMYEHGAQVLYAELVATAAGDPQPHGN